VPFPWDVYIGREHSRRGLLRMPTQWTAVSRAASLLGLGTCLRVDQPDASPGAGRGRSVKPYRWPAVPGVRQRGLGGPIRDAGSGNAVVPGMVDRTVRGEKRYRSPESGHHSCSFTDRQPALRTIDILMHPRAYRQAPAGAKEPVRRHTGRQGRKQGGQLGANGGSVDSKFGAHRRKKVSPRRARQELCVKGSCHVRRVPAAWMPREAQPSPGIWSNRRGTPHENCRGRANQPEDAENKKTECMCREAFLKRLGISRNSRITIGGSRREAEARCQTVASLLLIFRGKPRRTPVHTLLSCPQQNRSDRP
jgi:hypothetical protein